MIQRSTRNILLLLGLALVIAVVVPLIDGFAGATGNTPHEVWGMLPAEWRQVREQIVFGVLTIVLIGSWLAAHLVFKRAVQYQIGAPCCAVCNYSLTGLSEGGVCPECGGAARAFTGKTSGEQRFKAVALVQAVGTVALLICLLSIAPQHAGLVLFHAVMTLPVLLVAKDKRLTASEAAFVSGMMFLTISSLTVYSICDSTHSGDGQAAFGLLGASCSGWLFAGPGYLVSAIGVWAYRWQQPNRNKSESE